MYLSFWIKYEPSVQSRRHLSDQLFPNTILQQLLWVNLEMKDSRCHIGKRVLTIWMFVLKSVQLLIPSSPKWINL